MTIMIALDIEYVKSDLCINKVCVIESDVHNKYTYCTYCSTT